MIEVMQMILNYNGYLNFDLPANWCSEEDNDNLILYNPSGVGAIILSFFGVLKAEDSLEENISILAKRFIDQNNIKLHSHLIVFNTKDGKTVLYGTGTTCEGYFLKLWVVSKYPKIVFATYQSEHKNKEIQICDSIMDSIQFRY